MRYHRTDIVERAVDILDTYGLPDLSMRRIAGELGLQPSALYHHFANKQALLAAVADEVLTRGARTAADEAWDSRVRSIGHELRDAMLAYRDGAELIATVHAFGLGSVDLEGRLADAISGGGFDSDLARSAATTILYFVLGHVSDEQLHLQAGSAGAIDDEPPSGSGSFDLGLALILDGVRLRHPSGAVT